MKRSVRGQGIGEALGALLVVACLVTAVVVFGGWQNGHGNLHNDLTAVFAAARSGAQGGGSEVVIAQSGTNTSISVCQGSSSSPCYAISPTQTIYGSMVIHENGTDLTSAEFSVLPNGTATIVGVGSCPADLAITMGNSSFPVSCDPLAVQ